MAAKSDDTAETDFGWAVTLMRAGFLGRTLVYTAVAGVSLWAIITGGRASGTSGALSRVENVAGGVPVLILIALGMVAYAVWRVADSYYDLENYGTGAKGIVARIGMIATGAIHIGIGAIAIKLLLNTGGGTSAISVIAGIMDLPGGRWLIGAAGLIVCGTGVYYIQNGATRKYRRTLRANHWTRKLGPIMTAGMIANGLIVMSIGSLFVLSAIRCSPGDAGGLGEVFKWAYSTPYGSAVVIAICLGLLAFATLCAVRAIWGVVPKAAHHDIETLAQAIADTATPDRT